MKKSWRQQTPNWPEEDKPNNKVALLGFVSIIWLGIFYGITAKLAFWIFNSSLEWNKAIIFGVVAAFTRGLDSFMNRR